MAVEEPDKIWPERPQTEWANPIDENSTTPHTFAREFNDIRAAINAAELSRGDLSPQEQDFNFHFGDGVGLADEREISVRRSHGMVWYYVRMWANGLNPTDTAFSLFLTGMPRTVDPIPIPLVTRSFSGEPDLTHRASLGRNRDFLSVFPILRRTGFFQVEIGPIIYPEAL